MLCYQGLLLGARLVEKHSFFFTEKNILAKIIKLFCNKQTKRGSGKRDVGRPRRRSVSYTHLDVYKRQHVLTRSRTAHEHRTAAHYTALMKYTDKLCTMMMMNTDDDVVKKSL